jgi:hypothetical protein
MTPQIRVGTPRDTDRIRALLTAGDLPIDDLVAAEPCWRQPRGRSSSAWGIRVTERQTVPESVRANAEFRSLCPASAVCMAKNLV